MQTYINLNPDDTDIHKYAGHLLFENGAFEDALQAYENGTIDPIPENIDVFLTKSKTHFLLGNIDECIKDMETALSFRKADQGISFDISALKLLRIFLNTVILLLYSILKMMQGFLPPNRSSLNFFIWEKVSNSGGYSEKPKSKSLKPCLHSMKETIVPPAGSFTSQSNSNKRVLWKFLNSSFNRKRNKNISFSLRCNTTELYVTSSWGKK